MSENKKNSIRYRCPVCFARENDVVLLKKSEDDFYCVKCSFTGNLETVQMMYADLRKKYKMITRRYTMEELKNL